MQINQNQPKKPKNKRTKNNKDNGFFSRIKTSKKVEIVGAFCTLKIFS